MLFFDNEYGNCREISSLGVTVAFSPDGVTGDVGPRRSRPSLRKYRERLLRLGLIMQSSRTWCFLFPLDVARGQTRGRSSSAAAR